MTIALDLAAVAALVGHPARANMLAALLDGRGLTAGELARCAGVTPATASGHLAKLTAGGLLTSTPAGRSRYYRLASRAVAVMLESIATLHAHAPDRPRATPRVPAELRAARTCYDHMAGRLAVGIAEAMAAASELVFTDDSAEVTEAGLRRLAALGVEPPGGRRTQRPYCRICTDWSERRPHIAGILGAEILTRSLEHGLVTRGATPRALVITPRGKATYRDLFGLET